MRNGNDIHVIINIRGNASVSFNTTVSMSSNAHAGGDGMIMIWISPGMIFYQIWNDRSVKKIILRDQCIFIQRDNDCILSSEIIKNSLLQF